MSTSQWTNRLLVFLLVALPVAPIAWDYVYPRSFAKWMLADAANQYDRGDVKRAQQLLRRAYQLSPEIALDANFWQQLGRIELSPESPVSENAIWAAIVRKIPDAPQRAAVAEEIAALMLERKMYGEALSVLKEFFPPKERRSPRQNNLIAYARSLAKEDLDEALEEIDLALKRLEDASLLDTKAWVLHQMGRDQEAIVEIDRSIEILLANLRGDPSFEEVLGYMEKIQAEGEDASRSFAEKNEKMGVGWAYQKVLEAFPRIVGSDSRFQNMATLRYHRLRILEMLQDNVRAEEDSRWLDAFSPKPWELLD